MFCSNSYTWKYGFWSSRKHFVRRVSNSGFPNPKTRVLELFQKPGNPGFIGSQPKLLKVAYLVETYWFVGMFSKIKQKILSIKAKMVISSTFESFQSWIKARFYAEKYHHSLYHSTIPWIHNLMEKTPRKNSGFPEFMISITRKPVFLKTDPNWKPYLEGHIMGHLRLEKWLPSFFRSHCALLAYQFYLLFAC